MAPFCSVWVGDGTVATIADACITIKLVSQPSQVSSAQYSRPVSPAQRNVPTWRQWFSCRDIQAEEPLLLTTDDLADLSQVQPTPDLAAYLHAVLFPVPAGRGSAVVCRSFNYNHVTAFSFVSGGLLLRKHMLAVKVQAFSICLAMHLTVLQHLASARVTGMHTSLNWFCEPSLVSCVHCSMINHMSFSERT